MRTAHPEPSPEALNTVGRAEPSWVPVALTFGLITAVLASAMDATSPWDNLPWIGLGLTAHMAALAYYQRRLRKLEALLIDLHQERTS